MEEDLKKKIYCINDTISKDDSIQLIKNKIFLYLSIEKTEYYKPDLQYIWGKFRKFNTSIELKEFFLTASQRKEMISLDDLIEKITLYTGTDISITTENKPSVYTFEDFTKDKDMKDALVNTNQSIGFTLKDGKDIVYYNKDPIKQLKKKKPYDSNFVTETGARISSVDKKIAYNSILETYGSLLDNTIYFVDIYSYIQIIEEKYTKMTLSKLKKKEPEKYNKILYSLLKIYFNFEADDIILNSSKDKSKKGNYEDVKKLVNEIRNLVLYVNTANEARTVKIGPCSIIQAMIHINFSQNSEEFVDLEKIFNIFELSEDIPFLKYKSDKNNFVYFKIYKPITELGNDCYIDKKTLRRWKSSASTFQKVKQHGDVGRKRGVPKGLDIKIKLPKNRYGSLSIYRDGKIELKLFWDEEDGASYDSISDAVKRVSKCLEVINKGNIDIKYDRNRKL